MAQETVKQLCVDDDFPSASTELPAGGSRTCLWSLFLTEDMLEKPRRDGRERRGKEAAERGNHGKR